MNKGMTFMVAVLLVVSSSGLIQGQERQIYKTVDEDGSVIFTDMPPDVDAQPMDLPEISVIETNYSSAPKAAAGEDGAAAEDNVVNPRELRRMYRDFTIYSPAPEEAFWGTENTVLVSWGSRTPMQPGLTAQLVVNGEAQDVAPQGTTALVLDRGEHTVQAMLRDPRGRRLVSTDSVTFFVKQNSVNFNRPAVSPN